MQESVQVFGNPFVSSISCVGILSNIIVILVIRESMRMNGRLTQAQIHLTTLAFSDIGHTVQMKAIAGNFCFINKKYIILFQTLKLLENITM